MTREQMLLNLANELHYKGYRFKDMRFLRKEFILTPYETEVIATELKRLENESKWGWQ